MKAGKNFSGYLLITPGAKSHYTEIWKAVPFKEEFQKALEDPEFSLSPSLSEPEVIQKLENMIQKIAPEEPHLTLTVFRNVRPEDSERFKSHYKVMEEWEHPHLTRAFYSEYREGKQIFVLVTEYLHGTTLNRAVSQRGPNGEWGIDACRKILKAFHEIHQKNIIHGGIRPDSIVFDENGGFKVRGFGVLEILGGPMGSRAPRGPGALRFVPKELWDKDKDPDALSDIYSLGMTFYYLLSGSLPIKGDKPSEIYSEISEGAEPFVSIGTKNPNLPGPLVSVIDGMVEKLCEKRKNWDQIWETLSGWEWEPSGEEKTPPKPVADSVLSEEDNPLDEDLADYTPPAVPKDSGPPPSGSPSQVKDLLRKNQTLQNLLFSFIQRNQTMEEKFFRPFEDLKKIKGEMDEIFRKYENIVNAARDAIGQMEKLGKILEKNTLSGSLSELPTLESPSIFEKNEFFCAHKAGGTRILGYSHRPDQLLEMVILEWQGQIEKSHTSDLRVHLAEMSTQTPSLVMMDFTQLGVWDQVSRDLLAGFLSALVGKKTYPLLYKADESLKEALAQRKVVATFLSTLEDLDEALKEYRKKVVVILYPTNRKEYKKLAPLVDGLIKTGYTHFLADLSSKAIRGDDMEGLLEFYKLCKKVGVRGEVCSVTNEMRTVFKIMDLQELQDSYPDTKTALLNMGEACYPIEVRQFS